MIRMTFDPGALQKQADIDWWNAWKARAETATENARDAFEDWLEKGPKTPFTFTFNNNIWKDLKDWLMKHVFYNKCAYCERIISGYYGDAEHYRPKSAVKFKNNAGDFEEPSCLIPDPVNGGMLNLGHPGYFWLAYDWRNLVTACVFCNSGTGKNERFDIGKTYVVFVKMDPAELAAIPEAAKPLPSKKWPGYYYLSPASLDAIENPLLLNPLNALDDRNPRKHIRFGVRGTVAPIDKSPLGRSSIEVFQLKNEDLRLERQKAQENFRDKFYDAMRQIDPQKPGKSKAGALLEDYRQGRFPFSAAALDYREILRQAENQLGSE